MFEYMNGYGYARPSYGLLGRSLKHSFSPELHARIGQMLGQSYDYVLFEKEPEQLEAFLKSDAWLGLNVTIPYKEAVIPYCDELSPEAERIGAVNTLVRRDGRIIGHNTDYIGFKETLESGEVEVGGAKCLVLGSGGASKTVQTVLADMGAGEIVVVSRKGPVTYQDLYDHKDADLVVNTTPVGMYPDTGRSLIYPGTFLKLKWVVDLVYNPLRTNLLCQAKKSMITPISGLKMLVAQGAASAELFTGRSVSRRVMLDIENQLSFPKQNIVLLGMNESGRAQVAEQLAQALSRPLFDTDMLLTTTRGASVSDILRAEGEEGFRDMEQTVIAGLSKVTGAVISCGSGAINREENYYALAENGCFIFLNRDLTDLAEEGRPLMQAVPLTRLYQAWLPMYRSWCDAEVETGELATDELVQLIMDMFKYNIAF